MDKLDSLSLLINIAEAGSFSAVARLRAISTSTVTLAIQHLESDVGARLITRATRKLALTHEGELLLAGSAKFLMCGNTRSAILLRTDLARP